MGFGSIQVSPPQEHVVLPDRSHPWWQDHQPTSSRLERRRGDRAALAAMVATCHDAGVQIYVDAIVNHMASWPRYSRCGEPVSATCDDARR
ncbi:MAG: hypothetical protein LH603_21260 [Pseudonocardia sp.]|nr:hypothetical protein [Pseudonocardia sp.]